MEIAQLQAAGEAVILLHGDLWLEWMEYLYSKISLPLMGNRVLAAALS
jgi:hypothetical protein